MQLLKLLNVFSDKRSYWKGLEFPCCYLYQNKKRGGGGRGRLLQLHTVPGSGFQTPPTWPRPNLLMKLYVSSVQLNLLCEGIYPELSSRATRPGRFLLTSGSPSVTHSGCWEAVRAALDLSPRSLARDSCEDHPLLREYTSDDLALINPEFSSAASLLSPSQGRADYNYKPSPTNYGLWMLVKMFLHCWPRDFCRLAKLP